MVGNAEIFVTLRRHAVPFVVIGGHAVNYHGYQRTTEDVDVVWRRTEDSEHALLRALSELNAMYIGKEIDPATGIEKVYPVSISYIQSHHLMMLTTALGFLDLFDYIPGLPDLDVSKLFESSVAADGIHYASLDLLRQMKQASGRPKDKADLKKLQD
jgi:hypothetical protein